jgi:hypothetical protein
MKHESKRIMTKESKQCLPPRLEPTNQPPPRNERGRKVSSKGKKERKKEGEMISKIKLTTTSTKAYAPRATPDLSQSLFLILTVKRTAERAKRSVNSSYS